jgi:hypothetical protein
MIVRENAMHAHDARVKEKNARNPRIDIKPTMASPGLRHRGLERIK